MNEIYVLFPIQVHHGSATTLPNDVAGDQLNAWTLAWHPLFLANWETIPQQLFADSLPDSMSQSLVLVAGRFASTERELVETLVDRAAQVITVDEPRHCPTRIFRQLDLDRQWEEASVFAAGVVADFFALGYSTLQIANLARRLHFSSHYDPTELRERCVTAAKAAISGSDEAVAPLIRSCFDALRDIRHKFYPVDIYLLDWTLWPADVSVSEACHAFEDPGKRNLTLTGRQFRKLDRVVLDAMRASLESHRLCLAGLEQHEFALPMWPADVAVDELQHGISLTRQLLGKRPTVFARRRFGLSERLPMLLSMLGYEGAVHATLDAGRFPRAAQPRTQWYGVGCAAIDAVACLPLDRRIPSTLLQLSDHIGASIDRHYTATVCLAGWLGEANPWYDDLRRACQWAPVVGKFVTWDEYLRQTSPMGQHADFAAGEYVSPYLSESVRAGRANPVTRWRTAWSRIRQFESASTIVVWSTLIRPDRIAQFTSLQLAISEQRTRALEAADSDMGRTSFGDSWDQVVLDAARDFALSLAQSQPSNNQAEGRLFLNPTARPLRLALKVDPPSSLKLEHWPAVSTRHEHTTSSTELVVDIPAYGYHWVPIDAGTVITYGSAEDSPAVAMRPRHVAREWELENEFIRLRVDRASGGLAGLYACGQRENRLSQRLFVVRDKAGDGSTNAATMNGKMVAHQASLEDNSPVRGSIVTTGHVEDSQGRPLVEFTQRFELWRGMRHATLDIQLNLLSELAGDPWMNYVASRVAWQPNGQLSSVVQEVIAPMSSDRFDSPLGFRIADGVKQTWVQSMGLPFHRLVAAAQCDTILAVQGEIERSFQLRFCVDPPRPLQDTIGTMDAPITVSSRTPAQTQGWFFHLDARHVILSDWRLIVNEQSAIGVRVRLWESAGKMAKTLFRAARPIRSAQKCDFLGNAVSPCDVEDGIVRIVMAPFEWTDLECRW